MNFKILFRNEIKSAFLILFSVLIIAGCSAKTDDSSQLQKLISERNSLDNQIKEIEQRMAVSGDKTGKTDHVPSVNALVLKPELFSYFVKVRGKVESDNNIFVPAQRPNLVSRILVKEGDYVNSGQLMAELDNESILQSVKELENALELAQTLYERQKNLWEKKIGTEIQYLQAKTQVEDLQIKLKNVNTELEKTRIYSPIDGVVDHIAIKEGEAAIPNVGAIRVANFSSLKVRAKLAENMIGQVKRGDRATVEFPITGLSLDAKITAISNVIDPQNRTFDIELLLPDDKKINPNMLVIVTIKTYENTEAIIVPVNALQKSDDEIFVFIASKKNDQWIAELRKVTTGLFYNNQIEITSGLASDDVVITFGLNNVTLGEPVDLIFSAL
ncbi:MAG: efflux RND transporter periplasmic adaptor subunit [Bacteroidales bacterium]|nr:efflux RND transporter periplasmic adaptor subunit [Bacteroidales bacterium]